MVSKDELQTNQKLWCSPSGPPARSAQQVEATWWPRAGRGSAVGAVLVLDGVAAPLSCTEYIL